MGKGWGFAIGIGCGKAFINIKEENGVVFGCLEGALGEVVGDLEGGWRRGQGWLELGF